MINRLAEFPTSMRALERKLLDLEMSIRDLNEELKEAGVDEGKASLKGGSQFGAVGGAIRGDPVFDQAPAPPFSSPAVDEKPLSEEAEVAAPTTVLRGSAAAPSTTVIAGAATNYQRWRKDQKCGKAVAGMTAGSIKLMVVGLVMLKAGVILGEAGLSKVAVPPGSSMAKGMKASDVSRVTRGSNKKLQHHDDVGLDRQLQRKAAGRLFARAMRSATTATHGQQRAEPEPSETATVAPAPRETWAACPKESDIHSKMCSLGRVDPFEVGYACRSIPDHQPEGRAPNQPLTRVWQAAKVLDHAVDKIVYIGYEQPIEVFRAKLPSGREQLLTTEGWKLWILQRSALARHPKKALIAPKILMDEDDINEKIKSADIPEDVDATYLQSEGPLPDGKPVECEPTGEFACCSVNGWCGNSKKHCSCKGCVNYRDIYAGQSQGTSQKAVALPPSPPKDGHQGKTVVVIIPFRDRENHLKLFKPFWRWFAESGRSPKTVQRWVVVVAEQFDVQTFNRGWNFNAGLAVVSAQSTASPDIRSEMGLDFDCAVIQDIDYLPEKGVDYAECDVPTQLSAEIDRYKWKTPYLTSAGGIVGMSLKHWRKINGFGNNYFGWGGEDDELHHRLRLGGLLYGDCYPYCKKNDPNVGKPGQSIHRPKKGFGRFSGKFMHSANHTKRITDHRAYARNIEQLKEIMAGGDRWKTDGLNSLSFSIVDYQEDTADAESYGISYRHIKFRRGRLPFHVRDVPVAIPPNFCGSGSPPGWVLKRLGDGPIPWDIEALRSRAAALALDGQGQCPGAATSNFLLIDRRTQFAKIFSPEERLGSRLSFGCEARLLVIYLRSLKSASEDGLMVADPRPASTILEAFQQAKSFMNPPTFYSICTSHWKHEGPKYSIHLGESCGGGWNQVKGGLWRAYATPKPGTKAVSWCDNEKHWTQIFVKGTSCPTSWQGLKWLHGGTFFANDGSSFCVGTRKGQSEETSFSKALPQKTCEGEGFKQELSFSPVDPAEPAASVSVCVGQDRARERTRISVLADCDSGDLVVVARFGARQIGHRAAGDRLFCVESVGENDVFREKDKCTSKMKFEIALPAKAAGPELLDPQLLSRRPRLCTGFRKNKVVTGVDQQCDTLESLTLDFEASGLLDIAISTNPTSGAAPLYTIVKEEVSCFGFLCPNARWMSHKQRSAVSSSRHWAYRPVVYGLRACRKIVVVTISWLLAGLRQMQYGRVRLHCKVMLAVGSPLKRRSARSGCKYSGLASRGPGCRKSRQAKLQEALLCSIDTGAWMASCSRSLCL
ncbi:B4GALT6 [Symbiodinium sp. KB8]|nr:B4GALT6 [Symbiodinium sp. KB8]